MVPLDEDVTGLLCGMRQGNAPATERLFALVYEHLRRLAERQFRLERPGHTLQSTALVNEAFLELVSQKQKTWKNRAHFFAVASLIMRRILVDHARHRNADKRVGNKVMVDISAAAIVSDIEPSEFLAIDSALTKLARHDERPSKVVELRFFGGLQDEEIAEVLGVSTRTVKRDWQFARAWLHAELHDDMRGSSCDS